jgi:hypothetical protein
VGDGSGNANNATASATSWVVGHSGFALSFSGAPTSQAVAPRTPSLEPTTAITVEAWIKPSIVGTDSTFDRIVDKGVNSGYGLGLGSSGGQTGACFRLNSVLAKVPICTSAGIVANVWTHLAGTWSGTTMTLWVNGVAGATATFLGPISTPNLNLTLGNRADGPGGGSYGFNGAIDDVRIYARAKSAAEICAAADKTWTGTACQ